MPLNPHLLVLIERGGIAPPVKLLPGRLMEESSKARENGKPYALRTAANASLAVQRRQQQGR